MSNRQQFVVRLERELYDRVKGLSVESRRSMQGIVDLALRQFLDSEQFEGVDLPDAPPEKPKKSPQSQPVRKSKPPKIANPPWVDAEEHAKNVEESVMDFSKRGQIERSRRKG